MAKHSVYVSDTTEKLVAELFPHVEKFSVLVEQGLIALIGQLPERRVERAISKITRQQVGEQKAQLREQVGLDHDAD